MRLLSDGTELIESPSEMQKNLYLYLITLAEQVMDNEIYHCNVTVEHAVPLDRFRGTKININLNMEYSNDSMARRNQWDL